MRAFAKSNGIGKREYRFNVYKFFNKIIDWLLRLPQAVILVLLPLSFVFSDIFSSMQIADTYASFFGNINITAAVFIFGLLSWLVFELFAFVYFWLAKYLMISPEVMKNKRSMLIIMRWFFLIINIISGSVRTVYFNTPLAMMLIENVLIFTVEIGLLLLYYFYIRKKYVPPQLYPRSIVAFCAPYLIFIALNLFSAMM